MESEPSAFAAISKSDDSRQSANPRSGQMKSHGNDGQSVVEKHKPMARNRWRPEERSSDLLDAERSSSAAELPSNIHNNSHDSLQLPDQIYDASPNLGTRKRDATRGASPNQPLIMLDRGPQDWHKLSTKKLRTIGQSQKSSLPWLETTEAATTSLEYAANDHSRSKKDLN